MAANVVRGRSSDDLESLLARCQGALTAFEVLTIELRRHVALQSADGSRSECRGLLRIRCLGPFTVTINGKPIDLSPSGRPAAILKVLAHHGGRPVSRDQLIEALWPDTDPDSGSNRLRVAAHALRKLDPVLHAAVRSEQGRYYLDPVLTEIDAERFEQLVAEGEQFESSAGGTDRSLAAFSAAQALYVGDYFESDVFEDWPVLRRERLRDLHLNLLVRASDVALRRRDYEACIRIGHNIIRSDDCNEEAYQLLMIAHAARGNRSRAIRWFDICARSLRSGLGVGPSPSMVKMRDALLSSSDDATPAGPLPRLLPGVGDDIPHHTGHDLPRPFNGLAAG